MSSKETALRSPRPGAGSMLFHRLLRWKRASAPPMSSKETALRSPCPAGRAPAAPFLSPLPTRQAARGPHLLLPKENGPCTVQKKPLKGSPKMTSPGHFGGHVHAERLWAMTLRPPSGSRRNAVNVSAFRRVWRLSRRKGGSGHLALLFCRRLALPEESGAAAKEEQGASGRAPFLWFCGKAALGTRKTVGKHGQKPPPPESPKKSHGLFRPGAGLFLRPSFSAGKKKDPRAGSTPRRGARHVSRRPQTAYSPLPCEGGDPASRSRRCCPSDFNPRSP